MGYQVKSPDYFKAGTDGEERQKQNKKRSEPKPKEAGPVKINQGILSILQKTKQVFMAADLSSLLRELNRVEQDIAKNVFSVAVVGEFSKGKSTFLNKLIGKEILPVGNLPTTAILTRIRYHSKEMLVVFDEKGRQKQTLPLSQDSWEGLVAENFEGTDPKGIVLVGVNFKWLGEHGIELIDTPGAGDLEKAREQVIGDALLGCDGAIIAVSASAVLSRSEQLFIEERLITRKTPFLMLVITKMDQVPKEQRADIIGYTRNRLSKWNVDIPVYVPYSVEMPDDSYQDFIGMDKVKAKMEEWIANPERTRLTEDWLAARLLSIIETAISVLLEQKAMLDIADKREREKLIAQKKGQLSKAQIVWEDLRLQLMERSRQCYELFLEKADEYTANIVGKMQYEASHTGNPEKWWKEDYPYRLKVELTNMMVGINNIVMRKVSEDTQWFNASMDKNFKTHVLCKRETIVDKGDIGEISAKNSNLNFEDIQKERTVIRVGTAIATVAGFALMATTGIYPILATTGITTGSSIVTEKIFKGKVEKQRDMLKKEIGKNVPALIKDATRESEQRLKAVYDDVIKEAGKSEEAWLEAQRAAIEQTTKVNGSETKKQVNSQLAMLEQMQKKLQGI